MKTGNLDIERNYFLMIGIITCKECCCLSLNILGFFFQSLYILNTVTWNSIT